MEKTLQALDSLIAFVIASWEFDMWFYTQWWTYALLMIPFFFYTIFFIIKWWAITMPIWLPIRLMLGKKTSLISLKVNAE